MPIIQDEGKRMEAYLNRSLEICSSHHCSTCPTKDERLYDFLREECGVKTKGVHVLTAACSLGLVLGKRIREYGQNNNHSEYTGNIITVAKSLQINSVGNVNSEKIKDNVRVLRYLLSKAGDPTTINETLESPPIEVNLPEIPQIVRIAHRVTRRLPKRTG